MVTTAQRLHYRVENDTYAGVQPSPEELADLERIVHGGRMTMGNSWLQQLFDMNRMAIQAGLAVAKEKFGAIFTGQTPSNSEIGVSLIRPGYVLRTTGGTETPQNDWTFTFTADADNWIGFDTNNATAINIDRRLVVVPLGVWWTQGGPPVIEEVQFIVGNTTYAEQVVRQGWLADNPNRIRACPIRPMIWAPGDRVRGTTYALKAADQEMQLVGVAFAEGDLMALDEPGSVQV